MLILINLKLKFTIGYLIEPINSSNNIKKNTIMFYFILCSMKIIRHISI